MSNEMESLRFRLKEANELLDPLIDELEEMRDIHSLLQQQTEKRRNVNRRLIRMVIERNHRIAELETAVAVLTQQRNEADKRIVELEAQLVAVLTTVEATTDSDGRLYSEGCHQ